VSIKVAAEIRGRLVTHGINAVLHYAYVTCASHYGHRAEYRGVVLSVCRVLATRCDAS